MFNPAMMAAIAQQQQITSAGLPVLEDYVFTTSGTSAPTALNLTAPSGIQSGDFLVVIHSSDEGNNGFFSIEDSSWTKLVTAGGNLADVYTSIFYKIADGTETSVAVTGWLDANKSGLDASFMSGWFLRFSGVDTSNPIGGYSNTPDFSTRNLDFTVPSLSVTDNSFVILAATADGNDQHPVGVSTSGWTTLDQKNHVPGSTTGVYLSNLLASKEYEFSSATGVVTVTISGGPQDKPEGDGAAAVLVSIQGYT